ncbi:hypothetical protein [Rudaea sp.]|uniref:TolB family protein n=1 Tax=Rudaea sp. TaxID=2136325 RepID=UPI002ED33AFE
MNFRHAIAAYLYTFSVLAAASSAPELFAPGVLSTPDDEFGLAFAPDGKTVYFTKRSPTTNTPPRSAICVSRLVGGHWSEPEIAPFSGRYNDFGVAVAHDGSHIVFSSDRPSGTQVPSPQPNVDLWMVERQGEGWSEPRNLGEPVNTPAAEAWPSLAADGTLYFSSNRPGGKGGVGIWRARWIDGRYAAPEYLAVGGDRYDGQPAISPDQRTLVFTVFDHADTLASAGAPYSRSDLYVSFATAVGWTSPRHLDAPINSPMNESNAAFSPDGRWLYFASDRSFVSLPMRRPLTTEEFEQGLRGLFNGGNNFYRVPVAAIEALRGKEPETKP